MTYGQDSTRTRPSSPCDSRPATGAEGSGAAPCPAATMAEQQQLTLAEVELICRRALTASGLSAAAADAITDVVTQAERDECHSHGLFRVPGYCSGVLAGKVNGTAQPVMHDVAPAVVRVDARGGYAPLAILAGREAAVAKARESGIACLAIHNSVHFAALWWEVESLARDGIGTQYFSPHTVTVTPAIRGDRDVSGLRCAVHCRSVAGVRQLVELRGPPRRQTQALRHEPDGVWLPTRGGIGIRGRRSRATGVGSSLRSDGTRRDPAPPARGQRAPCRRRDRRQWRAHNLS